MKRVLGVLFVMMVLLAVCTSPNIAAQELTQKLDPYDVWKKYGDDAYDDYMEKLAKLDEHLEQEGSKKQYDEQDAGGKWQCPRFTEYTANKLKAKGYKVKHAKAKPWDKTNVEHHWPVVELDVKGAGKVWVPIEATPKAGEKQEELGTVPYGVTVESKLTFDGDYYKWDGLRDPTQGGSSDASGCKKDTFALEVPVFYWGHGFEPGIYDLYIVTDTVWTNGMVIPARVMGTEMEVTADDLGIISPTLIWSSMTLTSQVGSYDIIVDCNENGKYDLAIDALDDQEVGSAGFIVSLATVPTMTLWGGLAMAIVLGLLVVYMVRRGQTAS